VLVAASMPHRLLLDTLDSLGSDVDDVRAIDCISYCVLGDPHGEAIYIESPTILEKVLMSLEVVRRESQKPLLVVVDSFNAFYLHNDYRTMSAFLQIMAHRLKNNGDVGVLLSLKEQGTVENENMMHLISERNLEL
jgi:archaellum biogenesis ATPase FlaH